MNLKRIVLISVAAAAGIAALTLLLRAPESDEERLRRMVEEMATSASARDVSAVVEHVSDSFTSPRGTPTKSDLKRLLLGVLLREGWTRVFVYDATFEVTGDAATGVVKFVGAQGNADEAKPPVGARGYEVGAKFAREDGDWKVVEADWKGYGPGGY